MVKTSVDALIAWGLSNGILDREVIQICKCLKVDMPMISLAKPLFNKSTWFNVNQFKYIREQE